MAKSDLTPEILREHLHYDPCYQEYTKQLHGEFYRA